MKNKILIPLVIFFLSACTTSNPTFGVEPIKIPNLPSELDKKAERLPPITDPSLAGQVRAGIEADRAYNEVAHRNNKLIDFYHCIQKAINEGNNISMCLEVKKNEE